MNFTTPSKIGPFNSNWIDLTSLCILSFLKRITYNLLPPCFLPNECLFFPSIIFLFVLFNYMYQLHNLVWNGMIIIYLDWMKHDEDNDYSTSFLLHSIESNWIWLKFSFQKYKMKKKVKGIFNLRICDVLWDTVQFKTINWAWIVTENLVIIVGIACIYK